MTNMNTSIMLVRPSLSLQQEYIEYCQAFRSVNEPFQYLDELALQNFPQFVKNLQDGENGINLPPGYVPSAAYWLVGGEMKLLGNSDLRLSLTPDLEDLGGHIGYRIHPQERRKGYGTLILKLTMEKARERGLTEVLVTCDPANIASACVIKNNGGVLVSEGFSQKYSRMVSRYWIKL